MKWKIVITIFVLLSARVWSQEKSFILSGGYAFANIEDADVTATGWRINGSYEFIPLNSKVAHDFTFGYIATSAEHAPAGQTNVADYKINSWPIYYSPKFLFGKASVKGFLKIAIGMQFSNFSRTGTATEIQSSDAGFFGGASAGVTKNFENIFINLEYEWTYLSNSYYRDGFVNSVMLGIGFKF